MDGSKENGRRKKMKINRTRERILDKSIDFVKYDLIKLRFVVK